VTPAAVQPRPTATTPNPVDAWQAAVLVELRAIRSVLERQRRPSHLTRDDRDRLAKMLPPIGAVFGSALFTARELLEKDAPALRLVLGELNARQIGRLLQRAEGAAVGGLTVQREGIEVGAILWRVVATS
jgi:hypothetical protein